MILLFYEYSQTQRKFHTSFLAYKKLLEIVSLLRPELMDPIRAGYASLVAEGILSKKRMKTYFHSLPMKSCTGIVSVSHDLKEYNNASFKPSGGMIHMGDFSMKSVDSKDMKLVLSEMLPVVSFYFYSRLSFFITTRLETNFFCSLILIITDSKRSIFHRRNVWYERSTFRRQK